MRPPAFELDKCRLIPMIFNSAQPRYDLIMNMNTPMQIPTFPGNSDQRLTKFAAWSSEHAPGQRYTLEQIAKMAGVTRERIRQIESKALRKLRNPSILKKFEGALPCPR